MQVYPQVPPFPPGPSSVTLLLTPPPRRAAGKSAAACLVISTLHCPAPVAAVVRAALGPPALSAAAPVPLRRQLCQAGARAAGPARLAVARAAGPARRRAAPHTPSAAVVLGCRSGRRPGAQPPLSRAGPARSAAHASGGPALGRKVRRPHPLLPHVAIFSCMSRSTRVSCIRPPSDLAYGEVKRFTLVLQTFNN